jgi:hypothetical protein
VEGPGFLDSLLFIFRQPFLFQQVLGPGWHRHLYPVGVHTAKVLMEAPAEGAVAEVDEPHFP